MGHWTLTLHRPLEEQDALEAAYWALRQELAVRAARELGLEPEFEVDREADVVVCTVRGAPDSILALVRRLVYYNIGDFSLDLLDCSDQVLFEELCSLLENLLPEVCALRREELEQENVRLRKALELIAAAEVPGWMREWSQLAMTRLIEIAQEALGRNLDMRSGIASEPRGYRPCRK